MTSEFGFVSTVFGLALQQSGHLAKYVDGETLNKAPPCNPNPTEVGVISIITSQLQSEHFFFICMFDFPGLASNIFLIMSIILKH